MKKVLLTVTALVALFLTNCKKETANTDTTAATTPVEYTLTAQNVANIEGVKSLSNQDQKTIAFRLLSPIEKYGAWVENIRIVSADFTPQQKLLTVELVAFLTPQIFDNASSGKVASFRDSWLKKAQKAFTTKQIRMIAYTLFSTTDAKDGLQINKETESLPKCNCNTGSAFDCEDTACHTADDMQSCTSTSSFGCGFVRCFTCDNTCIILPKIPVD